MSARLECIVTVYALVQPNLAETVGVVVSEEPLLLPAHEGHHFCKISQKAASWYQKEIINIMPTWFKICFNYLDGFASHETKIYSKTKKKRLILSCAPIRFVYYALSSYGQSELLGENFTHAQT